jgi:predicted RNA binding protein YcfA (HicA-like mRNA interferase family)
MKPIQTAKFKTFLSHIGLVYKRTKGDHEIWDRPDDSLPRPVTFITNEKDVPPFHIKTNLKTIGMTTQEFNRIIQAL